MSPSSATFATRKSHIHRPDAPLPRLSSGASHAVFSKPTYATRQSSAGSTRLSTTNENKESPAFQAMRSRGS